jgi:hypothetical protein
MLVKKAHSPFAGGYKPDFDESPELDPTRANFYQSQIMINSTSLNEVHLEITKTVLHKAIARDQDCYFLWYPGPKTLTHQQHR